MYTLYSTLFSILIGFLFIIFLFKFNLYKLFFKLKTTDIIIIGVISGLIRSYEDYLILPNSPLFKTPYLWIILFFKFFIIYKIFQKNYRNILLLELIILILFYFKKFFFLIDFKYIFLILVLLLFSILLLYPFFLKINDNYWKLIIISSLLDFIFSFSSQTLGIGIESHYFQGYFIRVLNLPAILGYFKLFSLFILYLVIENFLEEDIKKFFKIMVALIYFIAGFRVFFTSIVI